MPHPHAALPARPDRAPCVRHLGDFPNPEDLAFARPAPTCRCIMSRSISRRVWPEAAGGDELLVEIFEPWLEPAMSTMLAGTDGAPAGRAARACWPRRASPTTAEIAERIAHHRPRQPGPGRPHGRPRLDRPGLPRADAGDGASGGRGIGHPDARPAAARRAGEHGRDCTTLSSARCAAATRARCSATRRSGSNPPPTAPAPCATRAACWRSGARCCPTGVRIRVVDSTADYRWMVLPLRPAGTEGWSVEARLAGAGARRRHDRGDGAGDGRLSPGSPGRGRLVPGPLHPGGRPGRASVASCSDSARLRS